MRRLKCYVHATTAIQEGRGKPGLKGDRVKLWDACLKAAGFQRSFMTWLRQAGLVDPLCLPSLCWCEGVLQHLEEATQKLAKHLSSSKSRHFTAVIKESWASGGSLFAS